MSKSSGISNNRSTPPSLKQGRRAFASGAAPAASTKEERLKASKVEYQSITQIDATKTRGGESGQKSGAAPKSNGRFSGLRQSFHKLRVGTRANRGLASGRASGRATGDKFQAAIESCALTSTSTPTEAEKLNFLAREAERDKKQQKTDATKKLLQFLVTRPKTRPKIMEEVMMPLDSLKSKHEVALISADSKGNKIKMASHINKLEDGESLKDILSDKKLVTEHKTYEDSRALLATLEQEQGEMAELAVKLSDGSASNEERLALSQKLSQNKADTEIAKHYIGNALTRLAPQHENNMGRIISLQALNERLSAHDEVCESFRARYAALLPEVDVHQALDESYQNVHQVESVYQALQIKSEQLTKDGEPSDARKVDAALGQTKKELDKLNKKLETRAEALESGGIKHKRLSKQLTRSASTGGSKPFDYKPDLPDALQPSEAMLQQGRRRALNSKTWGLVGHKVIVGADDNSARLLGYTSTMVPVSSPKGVAQWITPPYEGSASVRAAANLHAPNLATTNLENENGEPLYNAVRHGALDSSGFNTEFIKNSAPQETEAVLERHYTGVRETFDNDMGKMTNFLRDPATSATFPAAIEAMQESIADSMAKEVVKTCVLSDESKYQKAIDRGRAIPTEGLDVGSPALLVPINAINLMGVENGEKRQAQLEALRRVSDFGVPFNLEILNKETKEVVYVPVKVQLREFNFNVAAESSALKRLFSSKKSATSNNAPSNNVPSDNVEWGFELDKKDKQKERGLVALLGRRGGTYVGGAAGNRIMELEQSLEIAEQQLEHEKSNGELNQGHFDRISRREQDVIRIAKAGKRVQLLSDQLKQIWKKGDFRSYEGEANKFTARLALLCSAIGEPPILSDVNGMDRVDSCDAEAKYLAAQLDATGTLPKPDEGRDKIKRGDFLLAGGGRELRRYNDGLIN